MIRYVHVATFGCAALLLAPAAAHAATCQVFGTIQLDPLDSYYCDTGISGNDCAGWSETNLDSTTKPMAYMGIQVEDQPSGNNLGPAAWTDSTGYYSVSWTAASCSGTSFKVRLRYKRMQPGYSGPPMRFRVVKSDETANWTTLTVQRTFGTSPCSTNTCEVNKTFARTTNLVDRLANVYYTANSAITQISTWSSNLDSQFRTTSEATDGTGVLRIVYYDDMGSGADRFSPDWKIERSYSKYAGGAGLRHEIGHAAHWAMHGRGQALWPPCKSENFNTEVGHSEDTCEYGFSSTAEGLASFFAVRSIVTTSTTGNNAWFCYCIDNSNQDLCSETAKAAGTFTDADRLVSCTGGRFYGVGDTFASDPDHCIQLRQSSGNNGCNCPDENGNDICEDPFPTSQDPPWYQQFGFRNESQVARFMWDVIDSNAESGDDTNDSVSGIAADLEGMPCTWGSGYGTNGNCNEPNQASATACVPYPDGTILTPPTPMSGTRDSYNAYDLGAIIAGDQTGERTLNCVQAAD